MYAIIVYRAKYKIAGQELSSFLFQCIKRVPILYIYILYLVFYPLTYFPFDFFRCVRRQVRINYANDLSVRSDLSSNGIH